MNKTKFKNKMKNLVKYFAGAAILIALVSVSLFSCSADDEMAPVAVNTRAVNQIVVVSDVINANTTWSNDTVYQLDGKVYVSNGATLTIEAGTRIEGLPSDSAKDASALVITRGSKINAAGEECNPIVFTASNGEKGGWGGLVLLGKAVNNQGTDIFIEGIDPETVPAGVDAYYGGNDNSDNSGVLSYVRVEYAGASISLNNELNSFTFGSVGSGTQLDHLQAYYGADDAFEFFGGNVNAKYLISTATDDDAFDFDFGYTGKLQFLVAVLDPGATYSGNANGIESDNNATGATVTPYTRPVISNLTVVGTSNGSAAGGTVLYGAHFRRSTRLVLRNSVLYGYNTVIRLEGTDGFLGTNLNNTLLASDSSYLANNVIGLINGAAAYNPANPVTVNSSTPTIGAIELIGPFAYVQFFDSGEQALEPVANTLAASGAEFAGLDSWFTTTVYKGAISLNDYWIGACWVNTDFPIY
jgi:hypothetical protein